MEKRVIKAGFIGLGIRGRSIMNAALCCEECDVVAICDVHEDYMYMANETVQQKRGHAAKKYKNYV